MEVRFRIYALASAFYFIAIPTVCFLLGCLHSKMVYNKKYFDPGAFFYIED